MYQCKIDGVIYQPSTINHANLMPQNLILLYEHW